MKDTELFDAIAHIDEDLIERCFADEAAPVAGASKSPAAGQEKTRKPMPAFVKTALAIGAAAAALILMVGLISILHIGGESPNPIGPGESPSPAPTETATEAPTEAPTETPKAAELDFDSCAELVLRLPWGNGENEVFMQPASTDGLEEYIQVIPEHFNVIDGKVYIFDRFRPYGKGIIACDPETGNIERLSPDIGENTLENGEFAVMDGKLIFQDCMYDLSTGERTEIENALDRVLIMNVKDGKCFAFNAVNAVDEYLQEFVFQQATWAYDVFELDIERCAWVQKGHIEMPESVPHAEPPFSHYDVNVYSRGYTEVVGRDDGAMFFSDRYMGTDNAGNHYVDSVEESADKNEGGGYTTSKTWRRIIKLSPEGVPVSYIDVSYPDNYLFSDWGNYLIYKADGDGMVWYMCETKDEVLIYKIDLGNASAPDDTPEPEITPEPSSSPDPLKGLNENDYTVMRDFFELTDENGVRNGEKCFPNYDPADPSTWINTDPYRYNQVGWNKMGRVSAIVLRGEDDAPTELVGTLDYNELGALETVHTWNVIFDEVKIDSSPVLAKPNGAKFSFPMVRGEARIVGGYADNIFLLSAAHVYCELTGDAGTAEKPSFKIEVTTEGEGYAGVSAWSDENYYEVHLIANPAEGRTFVGWFDADGKLVSTDENYELFGEDTHNSAEGAHAEFVFTARFK